MQNDLPSESGPSGFLIAIVIVGAMAVGFALLFRAAMVPAVSPQIGKAFPSIEAIGWINGSEPTPSDLKGKILVVDAWAYWCGPCRMVTPYIIELHDKLKGQDVVFLGLTSEGLDPKSLQLSKDYVTSLNIPWINGYGATKTLSALEVEAIPQLWIVDRNNRIVFHDTGFNESTIPQMEQAIENALKN
jgi:thiol-disulfide isomerase/thioredoxin